MNQNTETRSELLAVVNASDDWQPPGNFCTVLQKTRPTIEYHLAALLKEGAIQRCKPPLGSGRGVKTWFARVGLPLPEGANHNGSKHGRPALPGKLKGFRAEARARRKRKLAPNRKLNLVLAKPPVPAPLAKPARWALTSDGSLILLDTGFEITRDAALALASFVGKLEGARV